MDGPTGVGALEAEEVQLGMGVPALTCRALHVHNYQGIAVELDGCCVTSEFKVDIDSNLSLQLTYGVESL